MASFRSSLRVAQPLRASFRPAAQNLARPTPVRSSLRHYSTPGASGSSSSKTLLYASVAVAAAAAGGFLLYGQDAFKAGPDSADARKQVRESQGGQLGGPATKGDYQKVYNAIAEALEKNPEYDDGSYGPVLVRLAWHASGTYDKHSNTGGSNGATMRFAPEANHGANAGLGAARDFMEEIKKQFPWITYADLWTLGGVAAIQEMGGPKIPWRPGRKDGTVEQSPPEGRLPDGDKGPDHLRHIFYKMGFNDQEIVALSGAHALGRCHKDRSGFEGPWTFAPTSFTNEYFNLLVNEKWTQKKWNGPPQFEDKTTKSLMMLMTDLALTQDSSFRKHVQRYAKSEDEFFNDFSAAFSKLLELGVPEENFKAFEAQLEGGRSFKFATTAEQENAN
ncbi:mitochondrial cytochrome c peroxidase [Violaceomyces palustris]|uniref:Mitochondrial cytochrome c peroxidase n=1 Tax=Violaceomyces palustris TaxID=1673888 RepID=A0ACD0P181_9BASI|nr:mitochondrial cytochrome c peroxidase [Violaceomyces palustris]